MKDSLHYKNKFIRYYEQMFEVYVCLYPELPETNICKYYKVACFKTMKDLADWMEKRRDE